MTVNLYHYSAQPFALDNERAYKQPDDYFKPCGLWLSAETGEDDDHGWKQWCEGEDFQLEGLAHRTQVFLNGANLLRIEDADALDSFTVLYRRHGLERWSRNEIDWPRIIARYDGILIAPYIWKRRMEPHTFWYYSWDCASACIWNSRVIQLTEEREDWARTQATFDGIAKGT